jgi:hypothetical protein
MQFKVITVKCVILATFVSGLIGCQVGNEISVSQSSATALNPSEDGTPSGRGDCTEHTEVSTVGVGGVTTATSTTLEELSNALPCFRIEEKSGSSEGVSFPYFSASRDGVTQLSIYPKADGVTLQSVVISGKLVVNTLNHPIGSLFKQVYTSGDSSLCQPGLEELSGKVICPAPEDRNIVYVFSGFWHGPDGDIPPTDILNMWELTLISWSPDNN